MMFESQAPPSDTAISRCPVMALMRYMLALLAACCPQPVTRYMARVPSATSQSGVKPRVACPFVRLLLLLGMPLVTAAAAMHPPLMRSAHFARMPPSRFASAGGCRGMALFSGCNGVRKPGGAEDGRRVVILGGGWVGSRVANHLADDGADVTVTSRDRADAAAKQAYYQPAELSEQVARQRFELECRESWSNLPPIDNTCDVIVTFPFADAKAAVDFYGSYLSRARSVLVCSSTSVYEVQLPNQRVTEETPLRSDTARGHAEEELRLRGATLLSLGGIFGDVSEQALLPFDAAQRTVCSCLAMHTAPGRPKTSAGKLINLVHIDDIVAAMSACLRVPQPGSRINLVSCTLALRELALECGLAGSASIDYELPTDVSSKLICNAKLAQLLPPGHRFRSPMEQLLALPCAVGVVAAPAA
ncbi:hypothetical protein T492DRAFT_958645 [Pavlovales sp. CCMP2436]|nr:hypothetical protein T492DRAFT_958645 [Pavlovales sp. CCMP2436]